MVVRLRDRGVVKGVVGGSMGVEDGVVELVREV